MTTKRSVSEDINSRTQARTFSHTRTPNQVFSYSASASITDEKTILSSLPTQYISGANQVREFGHHDFQVSVDSRIRQGGVSSHSFERSVEARVTNLYGYSGVPDRIVAENSGNRARNA